MNKLPGISLVTAALAVAVATGLGAGPAAAQGGGSSGTWPSAYPLPTSPGTVVSQSSSTATVRSTDAVVVVAGKLDSLYVTGKGCTSRPAVNKARDYFCFNPATHKTDEVWFSFAALDPTAADPSRSQSNAFYVRG